MMDVAPLDELIARAKAREAAAFDALVERYASRLYGYFYRLTGRRADAEDLLQDLFVRLVRMIGQYEHDGRFESWLFRIATNLLRDRVRRAKSSRQVALPSDPSGEEGDQLARRADFGAAAPGDRLGQAESLDRLQRALAELPEAERTVILLRHFSGMSFREIAEMMETPIGTALARAHRGLGHLRELMGDEM